MWNLLPSLPEDEAYFYQAAEELQQRRTARKSLYDFVRQAWPLSSGAFNRLAQGGYAPRIYGDLVTSARMPPEKPLQPAPAPAGGASYTPDETERRATEEFRQQWARWDEE